MASILGSACPLYFFFLTAYTHVHMGSLFGDFGLEIKAPCPSSCSAVGMGLKLPHSGLSLLGLDILIHMLTASLEPCLPKRVNFTLRKTFVIDNITKFCGPKIKYTGI